MADWFLDHGCTLYPTAYMAAPGTAAGLPQDGDGKASGTGAAPASASASLDFTGVTAAAGATIQVMGATLTCVASAAGTTQFNAGSGSTLAANLASAINAATSAVTVANGNVANPYLKAMVWAVAAGAVLTVHSRIASADLNQSSNSSCIIACGSLGNWTSPPANANFSGGVSGPWSLFFNVAALASNINASVGGVGTYGAFTATAMGAPAGGDTVFVRTARGGSNIEIVLSSTANTTVTGRQVGNGAAYLRYKLDAGTAWPGENGRLIISKATGAVNASIAFRGYTFVDSDTLDGTPVQIGGIPKLLFNHTFADTQGYTLEIQAPTSFGVHHTVISGVETYDSGAGSTTANAALRIVCGNFVVDGMNPSRFINCKLGHMRRPGAQTFHYSLNYGGSFEAVDCLLAFGTATTYASGVIAQSPSSSIAANVRLVRPKFTGGGGGHHALLKAVSNGISPIKLYIEDPIDMGQFIPSDTAASVLGAYAGLANYTFLMQEDYVAQVLTSANGDFLVDTPRYLLECRDAGFPTTGLAVAPGGREISVRFCVAPTSIGATLVSKLNPQRGIRESVVNSLGDGNLILTQRLLIDELYGGSSYTPVDDEWWIEGFYIGTDGATRSFTTRGDGAALAADSTAWSSLSYTPFAAGLRNYNRFKITETLTSVKSGTEVILRLMCGKQPATLNEWCFIDPAPTLEIA